MLICPVVIFVMILCTLCNFYSDGSRAATQLSLNCLCGQSTVRGGAAKPKRIAAAKRHGRECGKMVPRARGLATVECLQTGTTHRHSVPGPDTASYRVPCGSSSSRVLVTQAGLRERSRALRAAPRTPWEPFQADTYPLGTQLRHSGCCYLGACTPMGLGTLGGTQARQANTLALFLRTLRRSTRVLGSSRQLGRR